MVFVATDLVDRGRVGWWDHIAWLVRHATRPVVELDGARFEVPGQARQAADHFQRRMKLEPAAQTADLLERLADACGASPAPPEVQRREMLSWEQAREMEAGGVAIRCHTHTHRVLATLTRAEQEQELVRCRELLRERLGVTARTLAYPVGGSAHVDPGAVQLARELGYRAAFTYLTGHNRWGSLDPMRISRMEGPATVDLLAGFATLPELLARPSS